MISLENKRLLYMTGRFYMIKGVIFDLDGTLIDSMKVWNNVDRKFLCECGIYDPPENISDIVKKMTIAESSKYFISEFSLDYSIEYVINRIEELVRIEYEENILLKPDVIEVLDYLKKNKIPCGIATATYKRLAEAVLKRHGIYDRFRFVLTDVEYPMGKTSPDIFLGAAERMGFLPYEVIVAEDSLHCIETALKAGFFTVGVYDESSLTDQEAIAEKSDAYVMRLGDICKLI